eukprot:scaffold376148_cov36-Prasinocladus_malaysianus.AAC.1
MPRRERIITSSCVAARQTFNQSGRLGLKQASVNNKDCLGLSTQSVIVSASKTGRHLVRRLLREIKRKEIKNKQLQPIGSL